MRIFILTTGLLGCLYLSGQPPNNMATRKKIEGDKRAINLRLSSSAIESIEEVAQKMGLSSRSAAVELCMRQKAVQLATVASAVAAASKITSVDALTAMFNPF
jgi:hypothetical protein